MKKLFRKLHTSEVLLLAAYAVLLASVFLVKEGAGEDLNFFTFIAMVALSFWNVWRHKAISPVLYPFYIFLGYFLGALFSNGVNGAGSGPGAAIGFLIGMILLGLTCLELICGIVFATKDAYKMLILIILSFLIVLTLDKMFVTSDEMGEKGPTFYLDEYPDWRVLETREGF